MDVMASLDRKLGIGKGHSCASSRNYPAEMAKYAIIRPVGKGSFGQAVLVRSKNDGLHYIVKEINIGQMSDKERRDAMNEIAVLAKLHHPNIVRYHEHYLYSNMLYIVMEYADGGDLWSLIQTRAQQHKRLTEEEVLNYFIQICLALKHMHDQKMLHRDLKTGNIFLTTKGVVKLGDFGISTVLRNTVAFANTVCGTPNYFSPEMCQNRPYNNKSDMWALGCILYEMLSGKVAFQGNNMKDLYEKICRAALEPLADAYSRELRHLCGRLLAQSHAMRPDINAVLRSYVLQKHLEKLQNNFKKQQLALQESEQQGEQGKQAEEKARQAQEQAQREQAEKEAQQQMEAEKRQQEEEEAKEEAQRVAKGKQQRLNSIQEAEDFERELDALLNGKTLTEDDIMSCVKKEEQAAGDAPLPVQPDNKNLRGRTMQDINHMMSQLDTLHQKDTTPNDDEDPGETFGDDRDRPSPIQHNNNNNNNSNTNHNNDRLAAPSAHPAPLYSTNSSNDSLTASMRAILDEELGDI